MNDQATKSDEEMARDALYAPTVLYSFPPVAPSSLYTDVAPGPSGKRAVIGQAAVPRDKKKMGQSAKDKESWVKQKEKDKVKRVFALSVMTRACVWSAYAWPVDSRALEIRRSLFLHLLRFVVAAEQLNCVFVVVVSEEMRMRQNFDS